MRPPTGRGAGPRPSHGRAPRRWTTVRRHPALTCSVAALDTMADARIEETRSGELARVNWLPDTFHLVDQLMTQPLQVILAGRIGNTGSYESGIQLWKLAPNPVDLMVIDGAGHYEMYDEPEYVSAAVDRLVNFYSNNL
ncbi:hydrolase [Micromonospora sp. ATCC 39149]|nr:hydrolase [Micromonospora sp. ATCC 39149]